jgi:hypothetical protein
MYILEINQFKILNNKIDSNKTIEMKTWLPFFSGIYDRNFKINNLLKK